MAFLCLDANGRAVIVAGERVADVIDHEFRVSQRPEIHLTEEAELA